MSFTWTDLNIEADDLLIASGLGRICHADDPDFDGSIEEVGVMMNAANAEHYKHVLKFVSDKCLIGEPRPSKITEWVDTDTYLALEKAIFYYDTDNMTTLVDILETALENYAEELCLEPDSDNVCSEVYRSNPAPNTASTSSIKG